MITKSIKFLVLAIFIFSSSIYALELYQPPEPLQWKKEPYALVSDEIKMEVLPIKASGKVEYRFVCKAGGAPSSDWQEKPSYNVSGLKPETECTFVTYARCDGKAIGLPSKKITVKTRKSTGGGNTVKIDDAIRKGKIEFIPLMVNGDKDNRVNMVFVNRWQKGHRNAYNKPEMRKEFVKDCKRELKIFTSGDPDSLHPYPEYRNFLNLYAAWWPEVPAEDNKNWKTSMRRGDYRRIRDRFFLPWQRPGRGWVTLIGFFNWDARGGNAVRTPELRIGDAMIVGNQPRGILHEFSHTAPGVGDEYTSTGMWGAGGESSTVINDYRRDFCLWRKWIDKDTPVPTPYSAKYVGKVGLFEGGGHRAFYCYRSTARDCIMGAGSGDSGRELCPICKQRHVMRLYKWVDAIDERHPNLDEITIPNPCRMRFSVKRVHPVPDTQKTAWKLNGKVIATNKDSVEVEFTNLKKYELEFSLVDESKYIRPDPPNAEYPRASTKWTILNPKATDSSEQMNVTASTVKPVFKGIDNGTIKVSVKGGKPPYSFIWSDGGKGTERKDLAPGTYSVTVVDSEFRSISKKTDLKPAKFIDPKIVSEYDGNNWRVKCPAAEQNLVKVKWNTGEISAVLEGKPDGKVTCELLAPNGCKTIRRLNLKHSDNSLKVKPLELYASSGGENNGYVKLQVQGGRRPMRFFWSDGVETDKSERYYLCPGQHSVIVRDANGTEQTCKFKIKSEPAFRVKGLKFEKQNSNTVGIKNPDDKLEYLWYEKDIPGWLPRFPQGIYSGKYKSADGKVCDAEAYVILNKTGYYIKFPKNRKPHHRNDLGHWVYLKIFENGRKKEPRIVQFTLKKTNSGLRLITRKKFEEEKWTGSLADGRMEGKEGNGGSFQMLYISRPEKIDKPIAIGTSCKIAKPGNYFIAARKKSSGAISRNRLGVKFGTKHQNSVDSIDPGNVTSAKMLMWLDASDLNGDGKSDDGSKIPLRRTAMLLWQGKANDVNCSGNTFYEPNILNGLGVGSWQTLWIQGLTKQPKGYQTIIMVRREHDFSDVGTAPWKGLNPLIGVGEYGKKLFSEEAAKSLKNSKVFVNSTPVDPKTAEMPEDFYIATYEFDKAKNDKLGNTCGQWEGNVAEFLMFDGKLSDEERHGIEEYLRRKWLSAVDLKFD